MARGVVSERLLLPPLRSVLRFAGKDGTAPNSDPRGGRAGAVRCFFVAICRRPLPELSDWACLDDATPQIELNYGGSLQANFSRRRRRRPALSDLRRLRSFAKRFP